MLWEEDDMRVQTFILSVQKNIRACHSPPDKPKLRHDRLMMEDLALAQLHAHIAAQYVTSHHWT